MKRAGWLRCLAIAAALLPGPVAAGAPDDFKEVAAAAPLRTDRAYLLVRVEAPRVAPVFLRLPTAAEMERYAAAKRAAFAKAEPALRRARDERLAQQAAARAAGKPFDAATIPPVPALDSFDFVYDELRNVDAIHPGKAIATAGDARTVLVEALPGRYVLYGVGFGDTMMTCLCLGSVSFEASAGRITDLGTVLIARADTPSAIPELAGATGLGASMNGHTVGWAMALRPAGPAAAVPAALEGRPIAPARYQAVGKFVSPIGFGIARLAPIAGVLEYDRGTVIDGTTRRIAPDHYR